MSQTKAQLIDPVDGTIVNADINASAAIAGSKISPDFGSQNITTTGNLNTGGNLTMTGTSCLLNFTDSNNNSDFRIQVESGNFLIEDATNSFADRFVINSSGNIAIGHASPLARLHVLEDIYAKGSSGDGTVGIQIRSGGSAISDQHQIRTGGGTGQQIFIEALGSSSAVVTKVNSSERMRIDSSGRVLIGTTTEGYASADDLTVATSGNTGITIRSGTGNLGTLAFSDGTSGTAEYDGYIQYSQDQNYMDFATGGGNIRARIASDGKVGIGTVSPATNLHVSSSGDTIVRVTSADGNAAFLDLGDASDPDGGRIHYDSGSNLVFNTTSSERMRIDSSGKVFIGDTSNLDSNKVNIFGTKAYSSGIPQQQLAVADAQAYNTTDNGGSIGFLAKFNSGGAYTTMGSIEGVKHNNIDGNYQGALAFKTRNNNGDNVIRMRLTDNGLCFGTDTAGANALDDYEEGTWTPALTSGFFSGETYTVQDGTYVKIGGIVHAFFFLQFNAMTTSGGTIRINAPFTMLTGNNHKGSGIVSYHNISNASASHTFAAYQQNSTNVQFYAGAGTALSATAHTSQAGKYLIGYFTVRTA